MKAAIILLAVLLAANIAYAQNTLKITVKNEETKAAVAGAEVSVKDSEISALTDQNGSAELTNVSDGERTIQIFSVGYETYELKLKFPLADQTEREILIAVNNEVGEVTVSSTTRVSRDIEDIPTRIEVLAEEEIDEKTNMRPTNATMLLHESTGIQVQQTSYSTGNASVRIQGLDGKYTQILKDGFAAFGGFSGSLSLLDIPPLDLRQVDIIKGSASTLYGGGAIAGVVNFISKEPSDKREIALIFNQTSALGSDFSIFATEKFNRIGYSFLGSVNYQKEYDVDDDDFTELPLTKSFNINPKLFFYADDKTRLVVGNSTTYQNRFGGDAFVIRNRADKFHQYFERNDSLRNITTLTFDRDLENGGRINFKQSLSFFNRKISTSESLFSGNQFNNYTDFSYLQPVKNHALVFGANVFYDRFSETSDTGGKHDETQTAAGFYAQDNWDVTNKILLEGGFRLDFTKNYGTFALPRLSVLYKFSDKLTTRAGFGFGYKMPTIFTERAEFLGFPNIAPLDTNLKAERSQGATFDVNYKSYIGEKLSYSFNQLFFYTNITDPLLLQTNAAGRLFYANADEPISSRGFETNARFIYDFAKLFAGYTYTDAKAKYLDGEQSLVLLPKHRLNSMLLFEKERNFKTGFEAYFSSSQFLSDGFKTKQYWDLGLFFEKTFGKFSYFVNAENFTDTRQSRFGNVVAPPHGNPAFQEVYTHTEGRVFNGGVKIKL